MDDFRLAQREISRLSKPKHRDTRVFADCFGPEDLERARGGRDTLLVYLTHPRGVKVFVVDRTGVRVRRLDLDERGLQALRDRLWLQMDKLRLGAVYIARHRERLLESTHLVLDEFGQRLLAPIADRLGSSPVLVIPYGSLHDLPFHAFRLGGRFLVESHDVSYGLSTSSSARCRRDPLVEPGRVLVADVSTPSLAEVPREIDELTRIYGDRVDVVAPGELRRRLEREPPRNGLLHLAGHGLYQPRDPVFSALSLGDSFLAAHDLLRMRLDLQLVTLSGCETGRKLRVAGEELFGLTRALLGAGVRAALGSAWAVEDGDAQAFMAAFYSALSLGVPARASVCSAQRSLLHERPHPFSWAAFTLIGNPDIEFPAAPAAKAQP
jgi:CHAT domain-containing protein